MDDNNADQVRDLLLEATRRAEALQTRLEAGEQISEEEMTSVARSVAEAIEEANAKLRELIGPMDSALLREKMVESMTQEEFEQWSEDNAARMEYRAQKEKQQEGQGG